MPVLDYCRYHVIIILMSNEQPPALNWGNSYHIPDESVDNSSTSDMLKIETGAMLTIQVPEYPSHLNKPKKPEEVKLDPDAVRAKRLSERQEKVDEAIQSWLNRRDGIKTRAKQPDGYREADKLAAAKAALDAMQREDKQMKFAKIRELAEKQQEERIFYWGD